MTMTATSDDAHDRGAGKRRARRSVGAPQAALSERDVIMCTCANVASMGLTTYRTTSTRTSARRSTVARGSIAIVLERDLGISG